VSETFLRGGEIDAGCTGYPEHDHIQDGQEEVYVVLLGSGQIECDDARVELSEGMLVRQRGNDAGQSARTRKKRPRDVSSTPV